MSEPSWPGLPMRGDEPRIRQAGRPAFSYINKRTVFKRKQGMSRSSTVKRAIPANRAGLPLIKAGPLMVKTFLLTGWALPVTDRTTYALQWEKPRLISSQEIAQLSTLCTVLPIYNFASRDYLYLVANRYQLTYALRWRTNQITATVWVGDAGKRSESILHVVCKWNLSHIFRVGSVRFIIQFTPSSLSIKIAAMATGMFDAPREAVFNQLWRSGLDGVVYKHVILNGVRSCLTLSCYSHLGERADEHVQKDTVELHFCQEKEFLNS